MRLLVCGSRLWTDIAKIRRTLDAIHETTPIEVLISGGARGADLAAESWAVARGIPVQIYPAWWAVEGRGAGPRRNYRMLEEGKPDLVVAFRCMGKSRGTDHMTTIAVDAGVAIKLVLPD